MMSDENGEVERPEPGSWGPRRQRGESVHPLARRMHDFRQVLIDSATNDDIRAVGRRLLEKAAGGDVSAIKLSLEYLVGKPLPAGEPVGAEEGPLEAADARRVFDAIFEALTPFSGEVRAAVAEGLEGLSVDPQAAP